jgi:isoleucyl-tRNA synthetase
VREVVRLVQEARKSSGLEVSDRIELWWTVDDADGAEQLRQALAEQADALAAEVLAVTVHADRAGEGPGTEGPAGSRFWIARAAD